MAAAVAGCGTRLVQNLLASDPPPAKLPLRLVALCSLVAFLYQIRQVHYGKIFMSV